LGVFINDVQYNRVDFPTKTLLLLNLKFWHKCMRLCTNTYKIKSIFLNHAVYICLVNCYNKKWLMISSELKHVALCYVTLKCCVRRWISLWWSLRLVNSRRFRLLQKTVGDLD
jgi:hypothetical protein